MHPVEHLYYFTSVGPSLFLFASPFTFIWNGLHLIISPAAGHSGWEDHFQSNQFHYLHHRYFSKLVMDCVSKLIDEKNSLPFLKIIKKILLKDFSNVIMEHQHFLWTDGLVHFVIS